MFRKKIEGSIFRRFYVPKNWKVLYSEGSMFRKTGRFYIPKVLCSEISDVVDGHMLTGLNPFYGANHVFPEWHHNCVGSINIMWLRGKQFGVITEYLVIIFHTVQGTFSASRTGLYASFQLRECRRLKCIFTVFLIH